MAGSRIASSPRLAARLRQGADRPQVMGVLNVTPDSFSDGGKYLNLDAAVEHAERMIADGADIIDVGPESTRPGSEPVPARRQIDRAVPVIREIRGRHQAIGISIDTRLADVASAAIEAGADMVNDVSALRDDPAMLDRVAEYGVLLILMHRRGTPATMQQGGGPHYDDVVTEVRNFLAERRDFAVRGGVDASRILLDPGIGFGKRVEHNLILLRRLDAFFGLGHPVVLGASRKSFLGAITGLADAANRDAPSIACAAITAWTFFRAQGRALVLRVHDVAGTVQALRVTAAIWNAGSPPTHACNPLDRTAEKEEESS